MADADVEPAAAASGAAAAASAGAGGASATSKRSAPGGDLEAPWVEKYRPTTLDEVVGNEAVVERLRAIAEDGSMSNIILAGPPGTGKTTSVLCLARQMLGPSFRDAVLELNASDDRGIDVVRSKIKMFAQKKATLPAGRHKIVILDEADSMTGAAQQAMRRTMELYSSTTRFALACNNSTKIIEPIQSRCAVLRFGRLRDEQILERLLRVCEMEGVTADTSGLEALLFTAEGDMRTALNNLQSTHAGFGVVDAETVFKVCDQPHPLTVRAMITACCNADLETALKSLGALWREGYSAIDIVGTVFRVVKGLEMPEEVLLAMLREIGFAQMRVVDGLGSLLQLQALLVKLCNVARRAGAGGGAGAKA